MLQRLVSVGKGAARWLTHARVLLQADESKDGLDWTDVQIAARATLTENVDTGQNRRNRERHAVNWQFRTADARIKRRRLYPQL